VDNQERGWQSGSSAKSACPASVSPEFKFQYHQNENKSKRPRDLSFEKWHFLYLGKEQAKQRKAYIQRPQGERVHSVF
jgi:LAS superfamily LD-carboxypeptidase LdcB